MHDGRVSTATTAAATRLNFHHQSNAISLMCQSLVRRRRRRRRRRTLKTCVMQSITEQCNCAL